MAHERDTVKSEYRISKFETSSKSECSNVPNTASTHRPGAVLCRAAFDLGSGRESLGFRSLGFVSSFVLRIWGAQTGRPAASGPRKPVVEVSTPVVPPRWAAKGEGWGVEAAPGFEPGMKDLQSSALATWLCRPTVWSCCREEVWSARRDLNPRQPRWQRGALPTELLALRLQKLAARYMSVNLLPTGRTTRPKGPRLSSTKDTKNGVPGCPHPTTATGRHPSTLRVSLP
jgi:hypothetical protein